MVIEETRAVSRRIKTIAQRKNVAVRATFVRSSAYWAGPRVRNAFSVL